MAVHDPTLPSGAYPAVPLMDAKAEPTLKYPESEAFYAEALRELNQLGLPFLLAGTNWNNYSKTTRRTAFRLVRYMQLLHLVWECPTSTSRPR